MFLLTSFFRALSLPCKPHAQGFFGACSDKWSESGSEISSRSSTPPGITIFGDLEAMEGGRFQQCGNAPSTLRT
jgi:hypothetical protein